MINEEDDWKEEPDDAEQSEEEEWDNDMNDEGD